jgi:hypothetical protein
MKLKDLLELDAGEIYFHQGNPFICLNKFPARGPEEFDRDRRFFRAVSLLGEEVWIYKAPGGVYLKVEMP